MRVAVLTVSDAGARGERKDTSGDTAVAWVAARGATLAERALVPDDADAIVRTLLRWCDGGAVDLVLTTGGTGLSPRDVTPEATRAVIQREAPGFTELMRASVVARFPQAALSRATAGIRGRTLVINLPGSTGGVKDGLAALEPIVEHAVSVVRGDPDVHCAVCDPQP